ncbi:MAG TPA: antibiotic biosynthesis monooxygenase [Flavobacteriaceae bacterium]|nr:antibiotic biosynthesis monooxygenase [Flavobacteriaceae bacterium]
MFKRIVKLEFEEAKVPEFLSDFEAVKDKIRAFPGCERLELLQDKSDKGVFFTYSTWKSEEALEAYKNSALFGEVWPKTKALFRDKPMAWSVSSLQELN